MEETKKYKSVMYKPILALGELLIDLIPGSEGMRIKDPGMVIKTASGSSGIFACAAANLGGHSGFIGKVGRDSLSRMAIELLYDQKVDISHVIISNEGQIGLAFLEYTDGGRNYQYYRNKSVGSLLRADELSEDYIANASIVHYSGMLLELTDEMRGACEKLVDIAGSNSIPISFDPNIRSELSKDGAMRARLLWAVSHANIISPTLHEAQLITGEKDIPDILYTLHSLGPEVVALTRDKDGMILSRDGTVIVAEGIDVDVVDPTGAGDALAAALCVGLQERMPLDRLAAFCNSAGALTITQKGTIGMALPRRSEVDALASSDKCRIRVLSMQDITK